MKRVAQNGDAMRILIDHQGVIIWTTPALDAFLGWPPGMLRGKDILILIPQPFHAAHLAGFAAWQQTGIGKLFGKLVRVPMVKRAGGLVAVCVAIEPVQIADRRWALATITMEAACQTWEIDLVADERVP